MNFRGGKRTKKKRSKSLRKASGPFRNRRNKTKSRPPLFTPSLLERLSKHKYLSMRNSMRTSMRNRNKTRGRKS